MKEVRTIDAATELQSQDPIGVLGGDNSDRNRNGGRGGPADLGLKGSFEIAWELAH